MRLKLLMSYRHSIARLKGISPLDFIVPRVKTCESGSFFYHGIKHWNELPRHVKECKGKESFKENVKKHLMEKGLKKHNCEFHFY